MNIFLFFGPIIWSAEPRLSVYPFFKTFLILQIKIFPVKLLYFLVFTRFCLKIFQKSCATGLRFFHFYEVLMITFLRLSHIFWGFLNFRLTIFQNSLFLAPNQFQDPYLAKQLHFMGFLNFIWEFLKLWDIWPFLAPWRCKKKARIGKMVIFNLSDPKNGPKPQNSKNSQTTFGKTLKSNHLAKYVTQKQILGQK